MHSRSTPRESSFQRARRFAACYKVGATLQQIADQEGLSVQRVHQILVERMGLGARNGGHHVGEVATAQRQRRASIRSLRDEGLSTQEIATRFGITRRRVNQILAHEADRKGE